MGCNARRYRYFFRTIMFSNFNVLQIYGCMQPIFFGSAGQAYLYCFRSLASSCLTILIILSCEPLGSENRHPEVFMRKLDLSNYVI